MREGIKYFRSRVECLNLQMVFVYSLVYLIFLRWWLVGATIEEDTCQGPLEIGITVISHSRAHVREHVIALIYYTIKLFALLPRDMQRERVITCPIYSRKKCDTFPAHILSLCIYTQKGNCQLHQVDTELKFTPYLPI